MMSATKDLKSSSTAGGGLDLTTLQPRYLLTVIMQDAALTEPSTLRLRRKLHTSKATTKLAQPLHLCPLFLAYPCQLLFHNWSAHVLTQPVDHWCKPPALFAHLTRDQWLNVSVPVVEDSHGNRHHSQCAMYDLSTIVFNGSRLEVPCDAWDYDLPPDSNTMVSKWDLVCERAPYVLMTYAYYTAGGVLGAPLVGQLADRAGRRPVVFGALLLSMLSVFTATAADSFTAFVAAHALVALSATVVHMLTSIQLFESSSSAYRTLYIAAAETGAPLMHAASLCPWLQRMDLRFTRITLVMSMIVLSLAFHAVAESPRWLLAMGHYDALTAALARLAHENGVELGDVWRLVHYAEVVKPLQEGMPFRLSDVLLLPELRARTVALSVVWFWCFFTEYSIAPLRPRSTPGTLHLMLVFLLLVPVYATGYPLVTRWPRCASLHMALMVASAVAATTGAAVYYENTLIAEERPLSLAASPLRRRQLGLATSRALDRRFTEEMPVEVEGETIEEEEFNDAGWNFVRGKSSKQGTAGREPDAGCGRYGGGFGAPSQRSRSTLKKRVIASSRMPDLPEDHRRIVIRPRDGLDLRKAGHCKVAEAIMAAAKITYDAAGEDVVCPNVTQNIVVVSTPLEKHAQHYVCIKQIKVGEKVYNVNAYYSAGDGYCKGVIRNMDREITEKELNTMIVHSRNPTAMQATRIKDSGTVVIVFEGCEVPNYIKFGRVLLKCYLYRRQVDVCYICAKVGHRADVCPTPEKKICRGCGVENPTGSHECKAKCKLCGKGHPTGDRTCTQRYQTPFLVRQRRRERIEESRRERQPPGRFQDFPAIEERGDQRRSQGATPRSESAGPGSRSTSGPGHLPPQATWAQKAGDVKAPQVSGGSPTGQPGSEELKQIREENSLLKEMVMALKEEIERSGKLWRQLIRRPLLLWRLRKDR
ncbi:hypothetical protein HPB49_018829 [Dermacentor silvarum]|uniref:Uncharacterized protein n=1 Tax=Dermacentor silvarum TaxID=543639 RepID=A0ACB8CM55_DERSI|nr:hypothetical protein HPB49_018829 [Dermacentor silvarum]